MNEIQTGEVLRRLQGLVELQYTLNGATTLREIKKGDGRAYIIHPQVLALCREQREGVLHVLRVEIGIEGDDSLMPSPGRGLLPLFVASTTEYIYRNNQFITLSAADEMALTALYIEYLSDLAALLAEAGDSEALGRRLWAAQERHLRALQAFVARLDGRYSRQGESLLDRRVVCAEYSVHLQLSVLGIDPGALAEPILDIGCGRAGALVTHLRRQGLRALGMDRLPVCVAGCLQADWLDFHFQAAYWGTIISHMAFSNHFIFHHQYRDGWPELYAHKYMEVLGALRVGGEFYYAPGLPFIEPLLPAERFGVTTKAITPESAVYATRITRLA